MTSLWFRKLFTNSLFGYSYMDRFQLVAMSFATILVFRWMKLYPDPGFNEYLNTVMLCMGYYMLYAVCMAIFYESRDEAFDNHMDEDEYRQQQDDRYGR